MAVAPSLCFVSLLLCLVPLVAGYSSSSNVLKTKVPLAEDCESERRPTLRGGELYYFSLKHRDNPHSPFLQRYKSRHELLHTLLQRDEERVESFVEHMVQRRPRQATGAVTEKGFVAVDAGSPPDPRLHVREVGALVPPSGAGEYYTEFYVGTPPQVQVAMVDLASDVVWMGEPSTRPRKRRTIGDAVYSHFYPSSSSSFTPIPATAEACVRVKGDHVCGDAKVCRVLVATDGAMEFAYEDIRLNRTEPFKGSLMREIMISVSKVQTARCGVLGLGRGSTSLATQMANRNAAFRLAYCLADTDEPLGSALVFGPGEGVDSTLDFTPLVHHPHVDTFYFVNLIGVTVNGVKLPIPSNVFQITSKGDGGTIIDMSTRFSRLPKIAFDHVVKAMQELIHLPTTEVPGFHLCYSMANSDILRVPPLTLTFQNNATMTLPMENLFISASDQADVMCLAMVPAHRGSPTIIGSTQQQNFLMVVDTTRSRLGFTRRQCASLPTL